MELVNCMFEVVMSWARGEPGVVGRFASLGGFFRRGQKSLELSRQVMDSGGEGMRFL